jgi:hypothetical protein
MTNLRRSLCAVALVGCASTPAAVALHPEAMRGTVADPPGRILVMSATCGSVERDCRDTWAPAVDGLVMSGLEFHGFATIDPGSLRKDERTRDETTTSGSTKTVTDNRHHELEAEVVGIIPLVGGGTSHDHNVTVVESRQKTVVLSGASFEDLRLEDRQRLTTLAQAGSVLTTRITVGANYGNWTVAQTVEVMLKLASPNTGEMLWSTRCAASSAQFASVDAAIENAARCAVSAITGP